MNLSRVEALHLLMNGKRRASRTGSMTMTQHVDRPTFLAHLRQSKLLSDEQLAALDHHAPETDRGRVLARALVEWGWLTKFQAERLLAGVTSGFILGQYRILDRLGR